MDSLINSSHGESPHTDTCPLCGGPNQCALAADPSASECWCDMVDFPSELLAKIPSDAIRKRCVCQKCLTEYQEADRVSSEQ